MISGLVLKYLNGECFGIRRGYESTVRVSSSFWLTVPAQLSELEKEGFDESLLNEMRTFYRNRIKAQGCSIDF